MNQSKAHVLPMVGLAVGLLFAPAWLAMPWLGAPYFGAPGLDGACFGNACLGGSSARADSPFDEEQEALATRAHALARSPTGILPVLELFRNWDRATPSVTINALEKIAADPRLPEPRRVYVRALLARARLQQGELDRARRELHALGFITDWQVVGPFDNEGKSGFATDLGPETELSFDPEARWEGKERSVSWRRFPSEGAFGYLPLDAVLRPTENVCAVLATTVTSQRAQTLSLWIGAGGAFRAYFNGELVLHDAAYRMPDIDRHAASVRAHAGPNRLVVKSCSTESTWGLFVRLGDARGAIAKDIEVSSRAMPTVPAAAAARRAAHAPQTSFQALQAAASAKRAAPADFEHFARWLFYSQSDDPADRRALVLLRKAIDKEPSISRLALGIELAERRSEKLRFAERALSLPRASKGAGPDPEALLLRAKVGSIDSAEVFRWLDRLPKTGRIALEGAMLRAARLGELDLPESGLALVTEALTQAPHAAMLLRAQADLATQAGKMDVQVKALERLLEGRADELAAHHLLIADALRRRENDRVRKHLDTLGKLEPLNVSNLLYIATIEEAIGDRAGAVKSYARALEVAPDDARIYVAQGQLLLRLSEPEAAIGSLEKALTLRPQDPATRELLEQIKPRERTDERYALSAKELLARRVEAGRYPLTVLQDLSVRRVFDNGLGAQFHQLAVQIHDKEGARRFRTYAMHFDPEAQRVDLRAARVYRGAQVLEAIQSFEQSMGEPWYRVYYDTRAFIVVFPDLEPGDVVELQYRIDDVGTRNLFADYFGDVHFLQDDYPTRRHDYILIAPKDRQLVFNQPAMPTLHHEQRIDGAERIEHFYAQDIPAKDVEASLPGPTEISPYLHVSTYRSWDQVGRWWWGLIEDQLHLDEELRATVATITAGARDTREKVQRIYAWVIDKTRYVALEFGIHGFKPYRVTQIAGRGFGDCKDKASLLYAMLREAGIDAHLVLVRTRPNGAIDHAPASLAVFDHAIAYVPELDLYLDGTAEYSGSQELPEMDQGVMVLHVWPEGQALRQTPVLGADRNRRERSSTIELKADGSASIQSEEEIVGGEASSYRHAYEAKGTRRERFERALRLSSPGLSLESLEMDGLEELESTIRIRYHARDPRLAQRDGRTLRIPTSSIGKLTERFAPTSRRKHAIELGSRNLYREARRYRLPRGASLISAPAPTTLEGKFGRFELDVHREDDGLRVEVELVFAKEQIAAADYPAFRSWLEQIDRALTERIVVGGLR